MVWDGYVKPFKIFGNLYFVGTEPASTHLIDTEDGLILIDTGYQHSLYLILNNIWELGFSPYDIKYLIHTHGAMSYFFNVIDGNEIFRAGLHGGMGINTLSKEFLNKYNLPFALREDFCNSMLRLNEEKVDIFLGNHMQHNDTLGKREKVISGDKYAFVNPDEWRPYNLWCVENLKNMIKGEE